MQRFFDVFFSLIFLILALPLLIFVILILKFTGEGEIFFVQNRVGKGGRIFKLYKFATMLKDSPAIGTGTITIKNDFRVLPFGNILRTTKINEIPQLLNILLGDMSLVGPRPLTVENFNAYSESAKISIKRVTPGLSGLGSIIFRDEENIIMQSHPTEFYNKIIAPYKGLLEEWYIENSSVKIYFIIIFITIWVVIFPKSKLVWNIFSDLPPPPEILKSTINY